METPANFVRACFVKLVARNNLSHAYLLWGYGDSTHRVEAGCGLAVFLEHGVWDAPQSPYQTGQAPHQTPHSGDSTGQAPHQTPHSGDSTGQAPHKTGQALIDCLMVRPLDGTIGIDSAREAIHFIWQKPMRSSRKTIIVIDAECMTVEAQNASLKMVEEPPAQGLVIFIVRDHSLLLPTLASRFQRIYMPMGNPKSPFGPELMAERQIPNPKHEWTHKFLTAPAAQRKEMIKKLAEDAAEDAGVVKEFVVGLMAELDKNPLKNYHILKELVHRWMLMNQITVNKRIQLEAVNAWIPLETSVIK